MKRKVISIAILLALSSVASANNWMKLLQQSDQSRLRAEKARAPITPVVAPISSDFGLRAHPLTGSHKPHKGIDLAAAHGEPFKALAEGKVAEASNLSGFGNTIIIEHENGLTSLYAHASELLVSIGQHVGKDQIIGRVGQTGLVTGPHLHLEVHLDGEPIDPKVLLSLPQNKQNTQERTVIAHHSTAATELALEPKKLTPAIQQTPTTKPSVVFNRSNTSSFSSKNKRGDLEIVAGTYVRTDRSLWSIGKELKKKLHYPSLKNIMALLVDVNPRSFPTSNENYRLASVPLYIPNYEVFDALLPESVLTKEPVWLISQKLKQRYKTEASIYQIMHSLMINNPNAFVKNNLNQRLASVPLDLTTPADFLSTSHADALAAFRNTI